MRIRLPKSRLEWQRATVIGVVVLAFVVTLGRTICGWPGLPAHRMLSSAKYAERISLLKYFISLAFSAIVATWYVVCTAKTPRIRIFRISVSHMSWAWTLLSISVLSAVVEIYLTYKDFHYWTLIIAEGYANSLHRFYHAASLYMLHLTYKITDVFFFFGLLLVLLAVVISGEEAPCVPQNSNSAEKEE
jgi:hypothetical protein